MTQYRKKPVVIEAYRLPEAGDYMVEEFLKWADFNDFTKWESGHDETLNIETLEGTMTAEPGDWIIKGVAGEFYPCKPDIFAQTYERVAPCKHLRIDNNFLQNTSTCMDCGAKL